jgi:hypothetical protein
MLRFGFVIFEQIPEAVLSEEHQFLSEDPHNNSVSVSQGITPPTI